MGGTASPVSHGAYPAMASAPAAAALRVRFTRVHVSRETFRVWALCADGGFRHACGSCRRWHPAHAPVSQAAFYAGEAMHTRMFHVKHSTPANTAPRRDFLPRGRHSTRMFHVEHAEQKTQEHEHRAS